MAGQRVLGARSLGARSLQPAECGRAVRIDRSGLCLRTPVARGPRGEVVVPRDGIGLAAAAARRFGGCHGQARRSRGTAAEGRDRQRGRRHVGSRDAADLPRQPAPGRARQRAGAARPRAAHRAVSGRGDRRPERVPRAGFGRAGRAAVGVAGTAPRHHRSREAGRGRVQPGPGSAGRAAAQDLDHGQRVRPEQRPVPAAGPRQPGLERGRPDPGAAVHGRNAQGPGRDPDRRAEAGGRAVRADRAQCFRRRGKRALERARPAAARGDPGVGGHRCRSRWCRRRASAC